jgi:sugar/nucleoside kinase (ribokinase family)
VRVVCLGILVADVFLPPLERLPEAGELVAVEDFLVRPGGCAANTAIDLVRLGLEASVIGCVGDDPFGELVLSELAANGVDTPGVRRVEGLGTAKTVIVGVRGQDRRYIHTFGANAALGADDLDAVFVDAAALYVGGYLLLPGLRADELADRLRRARERGMLTVLDVAIPASDAPSLGEIARLLPHVDVFVPNEDEARVLTGEVDPHLQARALADAGATAVIVTRGPDGAVVCGRDGSFDVPAPAVDAIDESGAGDAFDAGLILGLLEGWDLRRSATFASIVGASACAALGCWESVCSRPEAEALLARQAPR